MFPYIEPNVTIRTTNLCNALMNNYNSAMTQTINEYKNQWTRFWNKDLPVEEMQAQLDLLATTTTDLGVETNALDAYFDKAQRLLMFLVAERPEEFADCPVDTQDRYLPDFPDYPYQKYMTAGWIYTIEESGRLIVTEPCSWE